MATWRGHGLSKGIAIIQLGQWSPWGEMWVQRFSKEAGNLEFDAKSPTL